MLVWISACLAITVITFGLEWPRLPRALRQRSKRFAMYGNLPFWAICAFVACFQLGFTHHRNEKCENTDVNSDISGIGIRLALYMPMCVTLATLLGCLFWSHDFGTKELGAAQLISTTPTLHEIMDYKTD